MATQKQEGEHTPQKKVRVPGDLWNAYGTVVRRVFGADRSEDLVEHMRATVRKHGTPEELAQLDLAEAELAERRARKGGRPRKTPPAPSTTDQS